MKKKILVVEDEPIAAMGIKCILEDLGYNVLKLANSGQAAIDEAGKSKPDLVLMDIKLHGKMDGIEAMRAIRARSDVPVIFMSGYADDEVRRRAQHFKDFSKLEKPIDQDTLKDEIERVFAVKPPAGDKPARMTERKPRGKPR